jgi:type IV secretory pathway ATPase VirB11/archaellum biosynthesis ATPase
MNNKSIIVIGHTSHITAEMLNAISYLESQGNYVKVITVEEAKEIGIDIPEPTDLSAFKEHKLRDLKIPDMDVKTQYVLDKSKKKKFRKSSKEI